MDRISRAARSRVMSRIRSKDTLPEIMLRNALWHSGTRYRKYYGREKIDIAFPRKRVAVFVDGCFWHSCPLHGHMPKSRETYWTQKLSANGRRSAKKDSMLSEDGCEVLHILEHSIRDSPRECAEQVASILEKR
jgi:DNA mismatch endonuclease (patch repair protein)